MGTTFYFDADLPLGDKTKRSPEGRKSRKAEVFVSDFFGTHEIYLRIDDDEDGTVRLGKHESRDLLVGLQAAMDYLGYRVET